MAHLTFEEIVLRLAVAAAVGAVIGVNRNLKHKPAGLRTHSMVAIGSALSVMVAIDLGAVESGNITHILQGILTGIGFLGAGVIIHGVRDTEQVYGLTTAASIWVVACLGIASGAGEWYPIAVTVLLSFVVLVLGGPVENFIARLFSEEGP